MTTEAALMMAEMTLRKAEVMPLPTEATPEMLAANLFDLHASTEQRMALKRREDVFSLEGYSFGQKARQAVSDPEVGKTSLETSR